MKKLLILSAIFFLYIHISSGQEVNCVRGQATPVIRKSEYPNAKFELQKDSITGIETVIMDNGDKLIIHNWGCEYYTLTFRFETTRYHADTSDLHYWFAAARRLITGIIGITDSPLPIKTGVMHFGEGAKGPKLGQEFDFGSGEIRDFVVFNRVEQISDKEFAVEISFSKGPL